ncbi:MAG: trimethylamine methyltransferase family protein [Anaerolineae bacterium]
MAEMLRILSRDECERIHLAALEVLGDVGVRVDDPQIVQLLQDAGASASAENVVRIPASLVEWALSQAPKTVRLADRAGHLWQIGPGGDTLVFSGNALYITRGWTRSDLTSADLAELARIVDACDNIHGMVGTTVSDYPPNCRDFVGFRIMAANTAKHLRPCIYTPQGGQLVLEMAQVLLGGVPLRERPIVSTGFSIVSPLHWTALALGVFRETAGFGVPVMINSEPLGGATAPITLAGCLVIGDADVLSGLVIIQLLEPGRPCIYNIGFAHVMDMRTAIALTGAPENALLQAAGADLARFHGLPSAAWMSTEAMVADQQAAFEKMTTGLAHAASGVNLIWGAGNLESTLAMSPEALVMDDEIAGYFLRFRRGFSVEDDDLAVSLIKAVGLYGDFLTTSHTLSRHRWVLSQAKLAVRDRRAVWEARGGKPFGEVVHERLQEILSAEPVSYLDHIQQAELERIEGSGLATLTQE